LSIPIIHLVGDCLSEGDEGVVAEGSVQCILSILSGVDGIVVGDLGVGIKIEESVGGVGLGGDCLLLGSEGIGSIDDGSTTGAIVEDVILGLSHSLLIEEDTTGLGEIVELDDLEDGFLDLV